jgi:glycerophosphoryl diester phosphodiesterase
MRQSTPLVPAENTIEAFNYALSCGCDGFEFDVRFTSDGRSALCHDPKFGGQEVASAEFSGLQRLGAPITCLEDVLSRFGVTAYLDIELKVGGHEEAIVGAIRAARPMRGFVVSSFLPEVLRRLHELDASLPLGYVCKRGEAAELWSRLPISVFVPQYKLVSQALVDEVHAAGLKLFTWTVNHRRDLVRLADWAVDGLICDDPKLLYQTFVKPG